jgi:fatty-acyl-CoA synthase
VADLCLARAHEAVATAVPEREALVHGPVRRTFANVTNRTRRLAAALLQRGLITEPGGPVDGVRPWECPQDRIALYLHNRPEYLEAMLGCCKARAVPVNVNYRYRAEELHYLFDDAAARVIVYETGFGAPLGEVLPDLAHRPALVHLEDETGTPPLPGSVPYETLIETGDPTAVDDVARRWSPSDRYILYTGGTTGMPKGVLWRQGDWLVSALGADPPGDSTAEALVALAERARVREQRILPAPPFMHGAAHWNAFSSWLVGGTVVIQDRPASLDAADVLETADREAVTTLLIVGDAFARPLVDELRRSPRPLPHLRHVITSGAQLSEDTKEEILDLLPRVKIVDILGSSESGRQAVERSDSGGTVRTGRFELSDTAAVVSEDCTRVLEAGDDELGWLAKEGRVPTGYLGDPAKSATTFPVIEGRRFSVPGDRARHRADGSIELHGRDSVTINTGGEKVFAEEVEHVLKRHPAVFDAVVAPRASPQWGQEVAAVVQLRPGVEVADEDLRAHTKARLAGYKAPHTIVRVPAVLRSPAGKADYRWAREQVEGPPGGDA